MATGFDHYHKWLGIRPAEQPPTYYRLIGVADFEEDGDVIANAADRQMSHIRTLSAGPHAQLAQDLLNELARARLCLLNAKSKELYDAQLARQQSAAPAKSTPAVPAPRHETPSPGVGLDSLSMPDPPPPSGGGRPKLVDATVDFVPLNDDPLFSAPAPPPPPPAPGDRWSASPRSAPRKGAVANLTPPPDLPLEPRPTTTGVLDLGAVAPISAAAAPDGYWQRQLSRHWVAISCGAMGALALGIHLASGRALAALLIVLATGYLIAADVLPAIRPKRSEVGRTLEMYGGFVAFLILVLGIALPVGYRIMFSGGNLSPASSGPKTAGGIATGTLLLAGAFLALLVAQGVLGLARQTGFMTAAGVWFLGLVGGSVVFGSSLAGWVNASHAWIAGSIRPGAPAEEIEQAPVTPTPPEGMPALPPTPAHGIPASDPPPAGDPASPPSEGDRPPKSDPSKSTVVIDSPELKWSVPLDPVEEVARRAALGRVQLHCTAEQVSRVFLSPYSNIALVWWNDRAGTRPHEVVDAFDLSSERHVGEVKLNGHHVLAANRTSEKLLLVRLADFEVQTADVKDGQIHSPWPAATFVVAPNWAGYSSPDRLHMLTPERLGAWTKVGGVPSWSYPEVRSCVVSPGGAYLVAVTGRKEDGGGLVFDSSTGSPIGKLAAPEQSQFIPEGWAFDHQAGRLAASGQNRVVVWDLRTGKVLHEMFPVLSGKCVHFLPDDALFVQGRKVFFKSKAPVDYRADFPALHWSKASESADGRLWAVLGFGSPDYGWLAPIELPPDPTVMIDLSLLEGKPTRTPRKPPKSAGPGVRERVERNDFADFSRDFATSARVETLKLDDDELAKQIHWQAGPNRPAVGARWGIGVYVDNASSQPAIHSLIDFENLTGIVGSKFYSSLAGDCETNVYGEWLNIVYKDKAGLADPRLAEPTVLGSGKPDELEMLARRSGVDAVAIFVMTRRLVGSAKRPDLNLKVRLVDVAGDGKDWSSRSISGTQIANNASLGDALVDEALAEARELFGRNAKNSPDKERAKERVALWLREPPDDKLTPLVELRFFHALKLVDPADLLQCADVLLGEGKGRILLEGPAEERAELVAGLTLPEGTKK